MQTRETRRLWAPVRAIVEALIGLACLIVFALVGLAWISARAIRKTARLARDMGRVWIEKGNQPHGR